MVNCIISLCRYHFRLLSTYLCYNHTVTRQANGITNSTNDLSNLKVNIDAQEVNKIMTVFLWIATLHSQKGINKVKFDTIQGLSVMA